jgi:hypothetical protein
VGEPSRAFPFSRNNGIAATRDGIFPVYAYSDALGRRRSESSPSSCSRRFFEVKDRRIVPAWFADGETSWQPVFPAANGRRRVLPLPRRASVNGPRRFFLILDD